MESTLIPVVAGYNAEGDTVFEQICVQPVAEVRGEFRLLKSPAFVRGLASGDRIRYPTDTLNGFELIRHSGNLCVRVLRKEKLDELEQVLTAEMEMLDGTLDQQSPGILVYSIHVSIGFSQIEALMDRLIGQFTNAVWYYGNVYDPADGVTPLNWWQDFARSI
ncbi:MAG: DUF4265 domain-containing protein [Pseudomonadales bacterium]|nr:DUF4265 domain-containing protein [Pseudomonadales bacterium]